MSSLVLGGWKSYVQPPPSSLSHPREIKILLPTPGPGEQEVSNLQHQSPSLSFAGSESDSASGTKRPPGHW